MACPVCTNEGSKCVIPRKDWPFGVSTMFLQIMGDKSQKELSYRKQIARQLRTQYVEHIYRPKY